MFGSSKNLWSGWMNSKGASARQVRRNDRDRESSLALYGVGDNRRTPRAGTTFVPSQNQVLDMVCDVGEVSCSVLDTHQLRSSRRLLARCGTKTRCRVRTAAGDSSGTTLRFG